MIGPSFVKSKSSVYPDIFHLMRGCSCRIEKSGGKGVD